jgi:hypothetical protein
VHSDQNAAPSVADERVAAIAGRRGAAADRAQNLTAAAQSEQTTAMIFATVTNVPFSRC